MKKKLVYLLCFFLTKTLCKKITFTVNNFFTRNFTGKSINPDPNNVYLPFLRVNGTTNVAGVFTCLGNFLCSGNLTGFCSDCNFNTNLFYNSNDSKIIIGDELSSSNNTNFVINGLPSGIGSTFLMIDDNNKLYQNTVQNKIDDSFVNKSILDTYTVDTLYVTTINSLYNTNYFTINNSNNCSIKLQTIDNANIVLTASNIFINGNLNSNKDDVINPIIIQVPVIINQPINTVGLEINGDVTVSNNFNFLKDLVCSENSNFTFTNLQVQGTSLIDGIVTLNPSEQITINGTNFTILGLPFSNDLNNNFLILDNNNQLYQTQLDLNNQTINTSNINSSTGLTINANQNIVLTSNNTILLQGENIVFNNCTITTANSEPLIFTGDVYFN